MTSPVAHAVNLAVNPSPPPSLSRLPPIKNKRAEGEAEAIRHPPTLASKHLSLLSDHGNRRSHPDALPLPQPAAPRRPVPIAPVLPLLLLLLRRRGGLAPRRAPAPPRQFRPRRLHEIRRPPPSLPCHPAHPRGARRGSSWRREGGLPRRRRRRQERPRRQGRRRRQQQQRREQRQRVRHGRVLPARAARGPREPAAAAQLRQVPARGGARPGGRRGLLRARAAGVPRRRRPAQPLRPRHLGGATGEGPRRGLLRARRAGRARRLLRARIVRELPVGRRGGRRRGCVCGRAPETGDAKHCGVVWLPGAGARVLSRADRSTRRPVVTMLSALLCNGVQYIL